MSTTFRFSFPVSVSVESWEEDGPAPAGTEEHTIRIDVRAKSRVEAVRRFEDAVQALADGDFVERNRSAEGY